MQVRKTMAIAMAVATILGALVLLVWGMLFWGVLYEPAAVFKPDVVDEEIVHALEQSGIATGTYFHPWPRNTPEARQSWVTRHAAGPFFRLSYVREGVDPQSPAKLLRGVGHNLAIALLATWLVVFTQAAATTFGKRVLLVFVAGSMGTLMTLAGDVVWFHMPADYAVGAAVYELGCWLLLGLVLAWYLQPRRLAPE